jgi:DNA-binding transcriptional LysR family regulator
MRNRDPIEVNNLIVIIVLEGSFIWAVRNLGSAPPFLTRRVTSLERSVGAKLFKRSTRHVALTGAGRMFVQESPLSLSHAERAWNLERFQREVGSGPYRVGYSPHSTLRFSRCCIERIRYCIPQAMNLQVRSLRRQIRWNWLSRFCTEGCRWHYALDQSRTAISGYSEWDRRHLRRAYRAITSFAQKTDVTAYDLACRKNDRNRPLAREAYRSLHPWPRR